MKITDRRFGAELVTKTGKIYKFDSLDCMVPFSLERRDSTKSLYVVDALRTGALIPVEQANFVEVSKLRSPMGIGVLASSDIAELERLGEGAPVKSWSDIVPLYKPLGQ